MLAPRFKIQDLRFRKFLSQFLLVVLMVFPLILVANHRPSTLVFASHCAATDLDCLIAEIQREIDALKPAHEYNKKELAGLREQLASLEKRIAAVSNQLEKLEDDITSREEELAYTKEILFEKVKSDYIRRRLSGVISSFLSASGASRSAKEMFFQQMVADEDRKVIEKLVVDLIGLKRDKEELEKNQASLAAAKKQVDEREKFLAGEVAKVESYIARLSSRQQQFIAQKLGSLNLPTTLGAGPLYCMDDRTLNPGFSPAFAFYTYGIPHRVGMNQYGAYGRAKENQLYDEILHAYYNFDGYQGGANTTIRVNNGDGINQGSVIWSGSLEDYMRRIYEVPGSWPVEALKAQAIAVRSYVLAVTNNGNDSICANQYCQVFKTDPKGGAWEGAVTDTTGKVMVLGGEIITAWYASTAGGYTFTSAEVWGGSSGWTKNLRDTSSGVGSFGDLNSSSYDKDSPCFYAAQGWRSEYGNSAWLKSEEVADIVNTLNLVKRDPSVAEHLYQVDKPNPAGTDTWSMDRVKQELQAHNITPLNSVNNISISADFSSGRATTVIVDGQSFTAQEFKDRFNLRTPANIQIVGPLYNIEKK